MKKAIFFSLLLINVFFFPFFYSNGVATTAYINIATCVDARWIVCVSICTSFAIRAGKISFANAETFRFGH